MAFDFVVHVKNELSSAWWKWSVVTWIRANAFITIIYTIINGCEGPRKKWCDRKINIRVTRLR